MFFAIVFSIFISHNVWAYDNDGERDIAIVQKGDSIARNYVLKILLRDMMINYIRDEGGSIIERRVERGETWGYLALRCGLEEWELQALNSEWDFLPAGSEILIAQFCPGTERYEASVIASDSRFLIADKYLENGDWKKAKKIYDELIDNSPSISAYYMRGIANYNAGKYGDAVDDFAYVVYNDSNRVYEKAAENQSIAQKAWEQQKSERQAQWLGIASLLVETSAFIADTYVASKQESSRGSTYSANNSESSLTEQMSQPGYFQNVHAQLMQKSMNEVNSQLQYFQNVNAQLMQESMNEVNNQLQYEYQQVRSAYLRMGKDITFDEFYALRGQALSETFGSGTEGTESYDNYESGISSSSNTPSRRKCAYCNGSGKIVKEWSVATYGLNDEKVKCPECGKVHFRSTGHAHVYCSHCHGGIPK